MTQSDRAMHTNSPPEKPSSARNPLALNDVDKMRHVRAVERIKWKLFCRYRHADYAIIPGSLSVVPPSTYIDVSEVDLPRKLRLGGVQFKALGACDGEVLEVTVTHVNRDRFNVFVAIHNGASNFVRPATETDFEDLDEHVMRCVQIGRNDGRSNQM